MTTSKLPESDTPSYQEAIPADADDWIRQFIKHFELSLLDASRNLPKDASVGESHLELLGQVVVERQSVEVTWSDALNQRRFELIDKEIQGSMTPAERVELAGLTRSMRDHVDSETNLPMEGARALHRQLLQLESPDKSE